MGGHGDALKKTKYFSIHDIPDSMVETTSKRDPDNLIYKTRRWVNFKKQQILYQQRDGIPNHMRTPLSRFMYRSLWAGTFFTFFYNIYLYNKYTTKK